MKYGHSAACTTPKWLPRTLFYKWKSLCISTLVVSPLPQNILGPGVSGKSKLNFSKKKIFFWERQTNLHYGVMPGSATAVFQRPHEKEQGLFKNGLFIAKHIVQNLLFLVMTPWAFIAWGTDLGATAAPPRTWTSVLQAGRRTRPLSLGYISPSHTWQSLCSATANSLMFPYKSLNFKTKRGCWISAWLHA